jgi:hypothetical protein
MYTLCIDSISDFTSCMASIILKEAAWKDMLVVSGQFSGLSERTRLHLFFLHWQCFCFFIDRWGLYPNGVKATLLQCNSSIRPHIYNFEPLYGDFVNVLVDCDHKRTTEIITQVRRIIFMQSASHTRYHCEGLLSSRTDAHLHQLVVGESSRFIHKLLWLARTATRRYRCIHWLQ